MLFRSSPDSPYSQDQGLSPSNISGYNEGVEITGSESFGRDPQESPQAPLSSCMIGSVAVGIIIVSGDSGEEKFSDEEQSKIIQEVQEGLDWLATVEPKAKLSFSYDIQQIVVSASPGPYTEETDEYEQWERDWRDAALAELGYQTGYQGYQKYASDLRDRRGTKWAYVTFFTKYPLHHFAYSIYSKVVMSYDNDGWGPDSLNRVFAHESCHIFGALDEYGSCRCESVGGQLSGPNGNCINCLPREQQLPCVMNANTLKMCDYTRKQIGWDDSLFP